MKKLLIPLFMLFFMSCEKVIDEDTINKYQLQEIRSGNHYCTSCNRYTITKFNKETFKVLVKLDTTLFVHNEGSQQNKLCGFYEDKIHKNSARISYHTISDSNNKYLDSLILRTYVYNNGSRNTTQNHKLLTLSWSQVKTMLINKDSLDISIIVKKDKYLYKINNYPEVKVTRTSKLDKNAEKFMNHHYYGGPDSITAPHHMRMWIKYDKIMLE